MRELTKESFEIRKDADGEDYLTIRHREVEKTRQGVNRDTEKDSRMYRQAGGDCPVQIIEEYLSKLNPANKFFFQRPKRSFNFNDTVWFENMVVGVRKIAEMMKDICKFAGSETIYTNHCLRATTASALAERGIERSVIKSVTGHKHESSLDPYIQNTPSATRQKCSTIINTYGNEHASLPAPTAVINTPPQASASPPTTRCASPATTVSASPPTTVSAFPQTPPTVNVMNSLNVNSGRQQMPFHLLQNAVVQSGATININVYKN